MLTGTAGADSGVSISATTSGGTTFSQGEEFEVDITVTNNTGSTDKLEVRYHDLLYCGCISYTPTLPPIPLVEQSSDTADETGRTGYWMWNSLSPGESVAPNATFRIPDDKEPGDYVLDFNTNLGGCPDSCDAPDSEWPYEASDSIEITVQESSSSSFEISARPQSDAVAPGEEVTIDLTVENVGDSSDDPTASVLPARSPEATADYYGSDFTVVGHTDDGGSWEYEGWTWTDVDPGEAREPSVTLGVADSIEPGEYTFAIDAIDGAGNVDDTATATVTVEEPSADLDLAVTGGEVAPGGSVIVTYRLTNEGTTTVGDDERGSVSLAPSIFYATGAGADEGAIDGSYWVDWTIAPGEELTADVELSAPADAAPGEYELTGEVRTGNTDSPLATDTATVAVTEQGFDPADDAFPFPNWQGPDPNGENNAPDWDPNHDHFELSQDDYVEQLVDSVDTGLEHIPDLPDWVWREWATSTYQDFKTGLLTDKHCYGMVFTVKQYYREGIPDSVPATTVNEITQPTGQFAPVETDIDGYHNSQLTNIAVQGQSEALLGTASIDLSVQLSSIRNRIDATGVAPVGLGAPDTGNLHQVLAYDYTTDDRGEITLLSVYDPNYPETEQLIHVLDDSVSYDIEYERLAEIGQNGSNLLKLIEGVATRVSQFVVDVVGTALDGVVNIVANSPVQIDATAPDGRELIHPDKPVGETPPEEIVSLTGAPAGEYTITIEGTGSGDYTIEAQGAVPNGGRISDRVSGRISDGETRTLTATVPETEGGEGTVTSPTESIVERYDTNGEQGIQLDELNDAMDDYFLDEITLEELNELYDAYFLQL